MDFRPTKQISRFCAKCHDIYQSGTKPNLVAKILATKFGSFFCGIYNALKNMFNIDLIMV